MSPFLCQPFNDCRHHCCDNVRTEEGLFRGLPFFACCLCLYILKPSYVHYLISFRHSCVIRQRYKSMIDEKMPPFPCRPFNDLKSKREAEADSLNPKPTSTHDSDHSHGWLAPSTKGASLFSSKGHIHCVSCIIYSECRLKCLHSCVGRLQISTCRREVDADASVVPASNHGSGDPSMEGQHPWPRVLLYSLLK